MPADALAPKSPEHQQAHGIPCVRHTCTCIVFPELIHLLGTSQVHNIIHNMNISFIIFKTIQHVNS